MRIIQKAMRDGWLKEVAIESKKERTLFELLSVSLGLGEASSIAVARSRGLLFASDDRVARREANLLGIKLTGTLGILKRAIIRKLISQKKADLILKSMIEHGFHSPIRTLKDID